MAKEEKAVETEEVETSAEKTTEETSEESKAAEKADKKDSAKKPDKKPAKTAKKPKSDKPGFFKRVARFFKDLAGEVKKIVWPTKKQVVNNTIVVLATCLLAGVFVWVLDILLTLLVDFVLKA